MVVKHHLQHDYTALRFALHCFIFFVIRWKTCLLATFKLGFQHLYTRVASYPKALQTIVEFIQVNFGFEAARAEDGQGTIPTKDICPVDSRFNACRYRTKCVRLTARSDETNNRR